MNKTNLRLARPAERGALIELQRRASLVLDDYREQLEANPDAIDLPAEQIAGGQVLVAEIGGRIVGFAMVIVEKAGPCSTVCSSNPIDGGRESARG